MYLIINDCPLFWHSAFLKLFGGKIFSFLKWWQWQILIYLMSLFVKIEMSSPINLLFNEWKIETYFQPEMFLIGVSNLFQNWTDFVSTNLLCTCLDNQFHIGPVTQAKSLSRQVLLILGLRKRENHFSCLSPLCSPFSWLFLQLWSHPSSLTWMLEAASK